MLSPSSERIARTSSDCVSSRPRPRSSPSSWRSCRSFWASVIAICQDYITNCKTRQVCKKRRKFALSASPRAVWGQTPTTEAMGSDPNCGGYGVRPQPRTLLAFPPEFHALSGVIADLVECPGVVEPAVQHHHRDRLRVADVLQRIALHDDEIRELALFERSDLAVEAERAGAVDGRTA